MKFPGYPRLFRLGNYWDKDGKLIVRRTTDNGKNWGESIPITY